MRNRVCFFLLWRVCGFPIRISCFGNHDEKRPMKETICSFQNYESVAIYNTFVVPDQESVVIYNTFVVPDQESVVIYNTFVVPDCRKRLAKSMVFYQDKLLSRLAFCKLFFIFAQCEIIPIGKLATPKICCDIEKVL